MRRVALLVALVVGGACAAGPVDELMNAAAPITWPGLRDPDQKRQAETDFDAALAERGTSPQRRVSTAIAELAEWLAEAERERGFAESVIGFAMPPNIDTVGAPARVLAACGVADAAIAIAARRAAEELGGEAALEVEQDAVHAREVVIPLLAARAAVLVATESESTAQSEALLRRARSMARDIEPVSAWAEAQRGAVTAGASYLLKDDKSAIEAADAAMRSVAEGDDAETVPTGIALEAALIATAASARSEGYEPARRWLARVDRLNESMPDDVGFRLALADVRFLAAKRGADETVNQADRVRLLSEAFRAYEPVVMWEDENQEERPWNRERAWWHAARAAESGDFPFEALPLIAITARSRHWTAPTDATKKEAARLFGILERARAREGANEPRGVRAEALSAAAGKAWASGVPDLWWQSPLLYLQLAEEYADEGREAEGLQGALLSASELAKANPRDQASRAVYTETLRRVHAWPTEAIDRGHARRTLVRLLAEQAANEGNEDAAREAVAVAGAIESDAEARAAWTDACWAWNALVQRTRDPEDAQALLDAVDEAEARVGELTPALAVYRASALLALGRAHESGVIADRFGPIWRADSALAPDGLEVEVRARVGAGDEERAADAARALLALDEARARAVVRELAERAWTEIEPLTRRLEPCPNGAPCATPAQVTALWLARETGLGASALSPSAREGWAHLLAGDTDSAAIAFERVSVGGKLPLFQLMGTAETLRAAGNDTAAFAVYREIAADTAFADPGGRDFWRAWTRMLEILARQNEDGSRTETIAREIARLRAMPSAPDHPDCLARLAEIEKSLSRSPTR